MLKKTIKILDKILSSIFLLFLKVYQKTISPDHSWLGSHFPYSGCRFYPSCSQYAKLSVKKSGFLASFLPICKRIIRCNPMNDGGVDFPKGCDHK